MLLGGVVLGYAYREAQIREHGTPGQHLLEFELIMAKDKYEDTINKLEEQVVIDLSEKCETLGIPADKKDGIIILDTNGQLSIGYMQLQRETIIDVYQRYLNQQVTWAESAIIALSRQQSMILAQYLIFEKDELYRWKNCADKLQLWDDVERIKNLKSF